MIAKIRLTIALIIAFLFWALIGMALFGCATKKPNFPPYNPNQKIDFTLVPDVLKNTY